MLEFFRRLIRSWRLVLVSVVSPFALWLFGVLRDTYGWTWTERVWAWLGGPAAVAALWLWIQVHPLQSAVYLCSAVVMYQAVQAGRHVRAPRHGAEPRRHIALTLAHDGDTRTVNLRILCLDETAMHQPQLQLVDVLLFSRELKRFAQSASTHVSMYGQVGPLTATFRLGDWVLFPGLPRALPLISYQTGHAVLEPLIPLVLRDGLWQLRFRTSANGVIEEDHLLCVKVADNVPKPCNCSSSR